MPQTKRIVVIGLGGTASEYLVLERVKRLRHV